MKTKTVVIVDPPNGWRYGFPKIMELNIEYEDLLRSSGYPEEYIPFALKYSRFWEEEVQDET